MRRLIDFTDVYAAFDKRLKRDSAAPIALALSGGGDSIALLHMAGGWARQNGRRLLVLTVDHGLNPDSADWTRLAGKAAETIGAEWRTLTWAGAKPAMGLPAAARMARHRLLADAARAGGACVILFAHTADDVAEGELMRSADAPTLGHLHDWSPSPVWPEGRGLFALRPLLHTRRAALRAWLQSENYAWLDDPANEDPCYARPRARRALAALGADIDAAGRTPWDPHSLCALARSTQTEQDGRLTLTRSALAEVDEQTARRFLSMSLICASGRPAPPRSAALHRLQARLTATPNFVATLAGARVTADTSTLTFARESGDFSRSRIEALILHPGQTVVWDGRFEIAADANMVVDALAGSAARLGKGDRARLRQIPAAVRPSLPALFQGESVALPWPFGDGQASARALAGARLRAACGLIAHESDISPRDAAGGMAQSPQSSYVEALALA